MQTICAFFLLDTNQVHISVFIIYKTTQNTVTSIPSYATYEEKLKKEEKYLKYVSSMYLTLHTF